MRAQGASRRVHYMYAHERAPLEARLAPSVGEVVSTPICPGTFMKAFHVLFMNVGVSTLVFEF